MEIDSAVEIMAKLGLRPVQVQALLDYEPLIIQENGKSMFHDVSHVYRVLIYADLLSQMFEKEGIMVNKHAVFSAIMIHDCLRKNEYINDVDHGRLAAEWAKSKGLFDNDPNKELILHLAFTHSLDDEVVRGLFYCDNTIEHDIVCDADLLDRFRDGYNDSTLDGPDESYIRIDNKTKALLPVVKMLCHNYFESETQYDPLADLVIIGSQLGIISA